MRIQFAVALVLAASLAFAAEKKAVSLFNGKDLSGWKVTGKGCEAEVKDGCIFLKAGNGLVQTEKKYTNYILELDWKALNTDMTWDSGIYFRYEEVPANRPWPKSYQVNLRKGMEGNLAELKAKSEGLTKPGEWNHFKLTVRGTQVSLEINGKPAWSADGLATPTGYIGLQAEVPGGGQFLFKNIQITELD